MAWAKANAPAVRAKELPESQGSTLAAAPNTPACTSANAPTANRGGCVEVCVAVALSLGSLTVAGSLACGDQPAKRRICMRQSTPIMCPNSIGRHTFSPCKGSELKIRWLTKPDSCSVSHSGA